MTGVAALAICAAFTSCSKGGDDIYNPEAAGQMKADQITQAYNEAFIKYVGGPIASNQDWGFGSNSKTRTAYTNSNMWESDGLSKPAAITAREYEVVMNYFRTTENPQSETVDLHNYFIQNVGYTDHTYNAYYQKDGRTETVTITNPGTNHMDYIFVGPGYYLNDWEGMTEPAPITWDNGDDHVNNFNANSGDIQYMKYSGSEWFGFHDSYGTGYSTPGHGDNGKYCAVNRNFVIRYIDVDGVVGCYVGFNYESGKTSEGWRLEPDGFFDDRVIKLVPGEGSIPPPSHNYTLRVLGEDLTFGEDADADFDFNDVVFDVAIENGETWIRLQAAGGTLPLYIDTKEVHALFGLNNTTTMVNTGRGSRLDPVEVKLDNYYSNAKNIPVTVTKNGITVPLTAEKGEPASKIAVPMSANFQWCAERVSMKEQYEYFTEWCTNNNFRSEWWAQ